MPNRFEDLTPGEQEHYLALINLFLELEIRLADGVASSTRITVGELAELLYQLRQDRRGTVREAYTLLRRLVPLGWSP